MELFSLKFLLVELLAFSLYCILPFKIVAIIWVTFIISVVVLFGLFFRGSETAIHFINLHTNKIVDSRTSKIETVVYSFFYFLKSCICLTVAVF